MSVPADGTRTLAGRRPVATSSGSPHVRMGRVTVSGLWAQRARGYLRDCIGYLGIAAVEVPFGLALIGTSLASDPLFLFVASSVPPVAATIIAARAESGHSSATWGKRREALRVASVKGDRVSFGRALWRNTVKIGIPWTLGHIVAFGAANGGFVRGDSMTLTATVLVYALILVTVLMGVFGSGRALHDRMSGTLVVPDLSNTTRHEAIIQDPISDQLHC